MTLKPGKQTIAIHVWPISQGVNVSRSKSDQTMKFGL